MTSIAKDRILAFLRQHGCPCRLTADGRIRVASRHSHAKLGCKGCSWLITTIACTSADARDYLGY